VLLLIDITLIQMQGRE